MSSLWPSGGRQIFTSWDSTILASVFLTLSAVSLEAGLWAQHSDMSFSTARRHWGNRVREPGPHWAARPPARPARAAHFVTVPAVGHQWPQALDTHDLPHVLVGRVAGDHVVVRQLVLLHNACGEAQGPSWYSCAVLCRPVTLPLHQGTGPAPRVHQQRATNSSLQKNPNLNPTLY